MLEGIRIMLDPLSEGFVSLFAAVLFAGDNGILRSIVQFVLEQRYEPIDNAASTAEYYQLYGHRRHDTQMDTGGGESGLAANLPVDAQRWLRPYNAGEFLDHLDVSNWIRLGEELGEEGGETDREDNTEDDPGVLVALESFIMSVETGRTPDQPSESFLRWLHMIQWLPPHALQKKVVTLIECAADFLVAVTRSSCTLPPNLLPRIVGDIKDFADHGESAIQHDCRRYLRSALCEATLNLITHHRYADRFKSLGIVTPLFLIQANAFDQKAIRTYTTVTNVLTIILALRGEDFVVGRNRELRISVEGLTSLGGVFMKAGKQLKDEFDLLDGSSKGDVSMDAVAETLGEMSSQNKMLMDSDHSGRIDFPEYVL